MIVAQCKDNALLIFNSIEANPDHTNWNYYKLSKTIYNVAICQIIPIENSLQIELIELLNDICRGRHILDKTTFARTTYYFGKTFAINTFVDGTIKERINQ